eukprot:1879064-Amphidinium_carterae.1
MDGKGTDTRHKSLSSIPENVHLSVACMFETCAFDSKLWTLSLGDVQCAVADEPSAATDECQQRCDRRYKWCTSDIGPCIGNHLRLVVQRHSNKELPSFPYHSSVINH